MFRLPFSFLPVNTLRKLSHSLLGIASFVEKGFPFLKLDLKQANIRIDSKQYVAMCLLASFLFFILILLFVFVFVRFGFKAENYIIITFLISLIITTLVFIQQIVYPKLLSRRKIRSIEQNLIPALQDMLVQLNSGIPIFNILVNLSNSNYSELSNEFDKAIKKINAGISEVDALEEISQENPSILFRRAIWQIVNGMKAGSNLNSVINETVNSLIEEQSIQISRYGSQLNPLAMFYMLIAVIVPSLGVTFITVLGTIIALDQGTIKLLYWGIFILVIFFQIMFLGAIKSRRPNLMI